MKIFLLHKIDDFFTKRRHLKQKEKLLKQYKYIHILPAGGIHTKTIIEFLNKYFDNGEHAFILNWHNITIGTIYDYNNVFIITNIFLKVLNFIVFILVNI